MVGAIDIADRSRNLFNVHILARPHKDTYHALTPGWSIAHGFAMLYLDGPVRRLLKHAPPNTELFDLLQAAYAMLAHSKMRPPETG
jgi:hypothetical protein